MKGRNFKKDVLPFLAVVAVECTFVGANILFKAATLKGMSYFLSIVYSYALSTLLLLPLLFIFPSSAQFPLTKRPLFFRIGLLVLIGFLTQIVGNKGIEYSSPTLSSAISNLLPAFTFILAVVFRMESVSIRSSGTQAKVIGTLVSIAGALIVVLYKGPTILSTILSTKSDWNWIIGGLLLSLQYLLYSVWYIIQAQVMEIYKAELKVVFLYNLFGTILSASVWFLVAEKDWSSWRLGSGVALAAVLYQGLLAQCVGLVVQTWALHLKGPVYVASFKPLSIAIAVGMCVIFLGDALSLGSVIGSTILCAGFYAVLWGKSQEDMADDESLESSSSVKAPFLMHHSRVIDV